MQFKPKALIPYLQDKTYYVHRCNVKKFEPEKYIFQDGVWKVPEYWYDDQSNENAEKVPTHIRYGNSDEKEKFNADSSITEMMLEERVAD